MPYRQDPTSPRFLPKLETRIAEIANHIYRDRSPLPPSRIKRGNPPNAQDPRFDDSAWEEFSVPGQWGAYQETFWLRVRFRIPERFKGKCVHLRLLPSRRGGLRGASGLIFLDGKIFQGASATYPEMLLEERADPRREHLIALQLHSGRTAEPHVFEFAELALPHLETEEFYHSARVALAAAKALDSGSLARARILKALDDAIRLVDFRQPGSDAFYESLSRANALLRRNVYDAFPSVEAPTVTCVGHAHLDVAWLWPLELTHRKAAATFSLAMRTMEQYPKYHFLASQAQLYDFVEKDHPELFEQVKKRVKEGRWEAPGSMWVEPDCNIPSGESFVRQFLFGKRFFRKHLGTESRLVWFPDSFGYAGSFPQIAVKCGMKYFMSTKISWSDTNRFPFDSFWWQGIDGTRLLTHFVTTPTGGRYTTYNGNLQPQFLKGCWDDYKHKHINDEVLMAFGWGDGGGGPTRDMMEASTRLENFPGLPRCSLGRAEDFFERLETKAADLPVWNDELYLEYHRGTLTSQGWIKRANRKNEVLYHNAELLSTIAMLAGFPYPSGELGRGWELLLRNQFHDILPGSSIPEVYEDARRELAEARQIGEKARDAALSSLAAKINTKPPQSGSKAHAIIVWNALSWTRTDLASIALDDEKLPQILDQDGRPVPQQIIESENGPSHLLFLARDIPACGYRVFSLAESSKQGPHDDAPPVSVSPTHMENAFFRLELDDRAQIVSLFDKRGNRRILPEGARANSLLAFEDKPLKNSAWDIDEFYQEKVWKIDSTETVEVIEEGPLRAGLLVRRNFLDSQIAQRIYLYRHVPRIDFDTEIEWRQREILLKAAFPVEILSTHATYEIPFGSIQRPTHRNTSWDAARFEVCGHKWADLSEPNYGVSILNDSKYGHDISENVIRLTLLRSPISPDPDSDQGHHEFVYSLYPHEGDWRTGGTLRHAYQLNYPLIACAEPIHDGPLPASFSLVSTDAPNAIVETVKRAERGGECVFRIYESFGQRGPVTLQFARSVESAAESNLIEEQPQKIEAEGNRITLYLKPFEIRTLLIRFAQQPS